MATQTDRNRSSEHDKFESTCRSTIIINDALLLLLFPSGYFYVHYDISNVHFEN